MCKENKKLNYLSNTIIYNVQRAANCVTTTRAGTRHMRPAPISSQSAYRDALLENAAANWDLRGT